MTHKLVLIVWLALVAITGVEVWLIHFHTQPQTRLFLLLVLSFVKASLIASYFMHLKYEIRPVFRLIVPVAVTVALLLLAILPDASRIAEFHK